MRERVAVLRHETQRSAPSETLESVVVDAEAEISRQGNVAHIFPTAAERFEQFFSLVGFALEALEGESLNPLGDGDVGSRCNFGAAHELRRRLDELAVALVEMHRAVHLALRNHLAVAAHHRSVVFIDYMENHAVIGRVGIVVVAEPVGCTHMDFDISHPHFAVDFNFGVEKIGTGIGVKHSGVDNPDALAIDGCEPLRLPQAVLPHILHQFFHGQRIKLPIKLVNIELVSNFLFEVL